MIAGMDGRMEGNSVERNRSDLGVVVVIDGWVSKRDKSCIYILVVHMSLLIFIFSWDMCLF